MEKAAIKICENGGDILNVGYGLGIIDNYISQQNPNSHHIIELHPQLHQNALNSGYSNVYLGDWRDIIKNFKTQNKKFNGIYFDTHNLGILDEWLDFTKEVDNILKPGGVYSYFNPKTRIKVEDYIINTLNYQRFSQIISIDNIKSRFTNWDKELAINWDYNFVWFIKPL